MKALVIVDMQNDFVNADGKLAVPNAKDIVKEIQDLILTFKGKGQKVIYTADWHEKDDAEFNVWPEHCVKETEGAKIVKGLAATDATVIKKTVLSAWSNPEMEEALEGVDEVFVVGVATEYCVKEFALGAAVKGLLTNLVVDAIKGVDEVPNAKHTKGNVAYALTIMGAAGVVPIWSDEIEKKLEA